MHTLLTYIKNVRAEFVHVSWPPTHRVIAQTIIVIAISIVTAIMIGLLDFLFTSGVSHLVGG